jgi:hypothetical protein
MSTETTTPKVARSATSQKHPQILKERQEPFHTLCRPESESFRADVQDQWRTSARRTQRSVKIASLEEKRSAVIDELDALGSWLFRRLRDSVVLRIQVGLSLTADVDQSKTWAWDECGTDLALAVIPDAYQFRFESNHERTGERVLVGNLAKYRQKFGEDAIEAVTYPLTQQDSDFFEALVANWLRIACDSCGLSQCLPAWTWSDKGDENMPKAEGPRLRNGSYRSQQTNTLLNQATATLRREIENARSFAYQQVISLMGKSNGAREAESTDKDLKMANIKMADPVKYPRMTAKEAMAALGLSRSAIYDHRTIERASTGNKSVRFTTQSILNTRNSPPE